MITERLDASVGAREKIFAFQLEKPSASSSSSIDKTVVINPSSDETSDAVTDDEDHQLIGGAQPAQDTPSVSTVTKADPYGLVYVLYPSIPINDLIEVDPGREEAKVKLRTFDINAVGKKFSAEIVIPPIKLYLLLRLLLLLLLFLFFLFSFSPLHSSSLLASYLLPMLFAVSLPSYFSPPLVLSYLFSSLHLCVSLFFLLPLSS